MPIKKTQEQVIIDFRKIHGDKYDYSLVKYKGSKTKVTIICKYHGPFEQTPTHHLRGQGCIKCSGLERKTNDIFIIDSNKVHNNFYDYSLVDYINNRIKVKIICPIHGVFVQTPHAHIDNKQGCPKCGGSCNLTTHEFNYRSSIIHNNFYDYSLVNYINSQTKVKIICPIHGGFEQSASAHLSGQGCPNCNSIKLTLNEFKERSYIIYNNFYDYSLVDYINSQTKVKIICPIHGVFNQRPNDHLQGNGCMKCSIYNRRNSKEFFIDNSNIIHTIKFDYSLVDYVNNSTKVKIICPDHGIFEQTPRNHMNLKQGCPNCINYKGENKIKEILKQNNIKFLTQKTFNGCEYKRKLKFDFYIIDNNVCIEFDGKQHFTSVKFWGGDDGLIKSKIRDEIKNEYCKNNNIRLIRISYKDINNIEEILKRELEIK